MKTIAVCAALGLLGVLGTGCDHGTASIEGTVRVTNAQMSQETSAGARARLLRLEPRIRRSLREQCAAADSLSASMKAATSGSLSDLAAAGNLLPHYYGMLKAIVDSTNILLRSATIDSGVTNLAGQFVFRNLKGGSYTLDINVPYGSSWLNAWIPVSVARDRPMRISIGDSQLSNENPMCAGVRPGA